MRLLVLALLLCITGCSTFKRYEPIQKTGDVGIQIVRVEFSDTLQDDLKFRVTVALYNLSKSDHLIQEIQLQDNTVVECFRNPWFQTHSLDMHSMKSTPHSRRMFIYPGEVEGADYWNNFAMLPSNMNGSVTTTTGPNFNKDYRANYKVQGRVTEAKTERGVYWGITYENDTLTIWLPDGSIHTYTDTSKEN